MIRIMADSTCDLSAELAKELGVIIIPLTINFGSEAFRDTIDLTNEEFFERLKKAQELPTTSQANPAQFEQAFADAAEKGDDIVLITISSKLSATMQSAKIAADEFENIQIHIVDSLSASFGAGMLVKQAVKMRDSGEYTAEQIAQKLRQLSSRLRVFGVAETLKYLKMGGRLSGASAFIGGMLGILPVLCIKNGEVLAIDKVRGEAAAMKKLEQLMKEANVDEECGICFANADAQPRMEKFFDAMKESLPETQVHFGKIGSVIGTHIGPGVVAFAYFEKE